MIDLDDDHVVAFINLAFDRMMANAAALGSRVSDRPDLDHSNSVFAASGTLIQHAGHVDLTADLLAPKSSGNPP